MLKSKFSFKRVNKQDAFFLLGLLVLLFVYLYKVVFEIQGNDEAFYLTIPQRILQGDVFIVDEWHGSQFSALLIAPFMVLRNLFFNTNDSIVLHFRYIYVFVHFVVSCIIYIRLRKFGFGSAVGTLFFFMFTPYSIVALSYNTLGLLSVCLTLVFLSTTNSKKGFFLSGFFFSVSVLCCPYLLFPFIIVFITTIIFGLIKKHKNAVINLLFFVVGCLPLLVCVLFVIFSKVTLVEFLNALPYIFSDPEHPSRSLIYNILVYVYSFKIFILPISLLIVTVIVYALDKKRESHKLLYYVIVVISALLMLVKCIMSDLFITYNFVMIPFAFVGIFVFALIKEKNVKVFSIMYIGAFIYSFCIHMTSNQRLYVISTALSIASLAGIILTFNYVKEEIKENKKTLTKFLYITTAAVLIIVQFSTMGYIKINHKFWSKSENSELQEIIEIGPYAGIRVTESTKNEYNNKIKKLTNAMKDYDEGSVLFFDKTTWYYLQYPNLYNASYSAWLSGISDKTIERLRIYYENNQEKIPVYIYIDKANDVNFEYFKANVLKGNYEIISTDDYYTFKRID